MELPVDGCPRNLISAVLEEVNALRALHGAQPLQHSNNLAMQAQVFIDGIKTGITHKQKLAHARFGEELVYKQWLDPDYDEITVTPENIVSKWLQNANSTEYKV